LNIVQYTLYIAIKVDIALKLIQELTLYSVLRYEAVLCVMFCDYTSTISFYLRNTKGDVVQIIEWILIELKAGLDQCLSQLYAFVGMPYTCEIRSGNITTTFDQMTSDESASKLIIIRIYPRMPVPSSADNLLTC
jgi:hypothetical protein